MTIDEAMERIDTVMSTGPVNRGQIETYGEHLCVVAPDRLRLALYEVVRKITDDSADVERDALLGQYRNGRRKAVQASKEIGEQALASDLSANAIVMGAIMSGLVLTGYADVNDPEFTGKD